MNQMTTLARPAGITIRGVVPEEPRLIVFGDRDPDRYTLETMVNAARNAGYTFQYQLAPQDTTGARS
jgi:hypothetical protein